MSWKIFLKIVTIISSLTFINCFNEDTTNNNTTNSLQSCQNKKEILCSCKDNKSQSNYHIVSPNGGEILKSGTVDTIFFCVKDTADLPPECINGLDLEFSIDSGKTWNPTTTFERQKGFILWFIPSSIQINEQTISTVSNKCLVKITTYNVCGDAAIDTDNSDKVFTIQ